MTKVIVQQKIERLNDAQRRAVEAILQGWGGSRGEFVFPIIEGPPGTGKTTVGVLAAARFLLEHKRPQVAYFSYTHLAADRALEAFKELKFTPEQVMRVVDPGRVVHYRGSPYYAVIRNVSSLPRGEQQRLRGIPILIGTLDSAHKVLGVRSRPFVIFDEFSQITPSHFFQVLYHAHGSNPSGYALLGDPNQLPVVTSQPLLRPNIGTFILARKQYDPHRLEVQYRMHEHICKVVNALREALNTYSLRSHESVRERTLRTLGYEWDPTRCPNGLLRILEPMNPCVLINTDSLPSWEETGFGGSPQYSEEAKLAARLAELLYQCYQAPGSGPLTPVILSPYRAQVGSIRSSFTNPNLEQQCITIYQAQGREYPCVIVSFARKNPQGRIGFLAEAELRSQAYVACSRPMAKLIILFSFNTFRGYPDYDLLRERCQDDCLTVDADPSWIT